MNFSMIQKFLESGKGQGLVQVLPEKALQEIGIIGQVIEGFSGGSGDSLSVEAQATRVDFLIS